MISPERREALQTAWLRLVGGCGVAPAAAFAAFDDLAARHDEPHRHYHTLEHVAEVLRAPAAYPPTTRGPSPSPCGSTTPFTTRAAPTTKPPAPTSPSGS